MLTRMKLPVAIKWRAHNLLSLYIACDTHKAKNWRSHGRQCRVKTDQGDQELTVKRPMCDNATKFRKVAM